MSCDEFAESYRDGDSGLLILLKAFYMMSDEFGESYRTTD